MNEMNYEKRQNAFEGLGTKKPVAVMDCDYQQNKKTVPRLFLPTSMVSSNNRFISVTGNKSFIVIYSEMSRMLHYLFCVKDKNCKVFVVLQKEFFESV